MTGCGHDTGAPLVLPLDGRTTLGKDLLGGKAWGVNRMAALGLPVPPAIVVTTHACRRFFARGDMLDDALWARIADHVRWLETRCGRRLGAASRPLLVSVRSGGAHSMPGMMDTILDLGMGPAVEGALALEHGRATRAREIGRRFVAQYRKVVLGGRADPVPEDPWVQLRAAVAAVFASWRSPRAQAYRRARGLSDAAGTAVTIQAMVFGDADARSGTGVLFSRNPIDGNPPAWGEWLPGAQGEEVVSGTHTPSPLAALREQLPAVFAQLIEAGTRLERDARDIQDIEFTVESGHLWLLQTRTAKRSPQAALRAAVAFAEAGLVSREEAVRRLSAEQVRRLPSLMLAAAEAAQRAPAATGEPACPGIASGLVVLDAAEAQALARTGQATILARTITSPDDLPGILAADGLLTEQGGSTSHAAVVCRELGRPCVVGCGPGSVTSLAGVRVTLDGASGRVWRGELALEPGEERWNDDASKLLAWGQPLVPMCLLSAPQAGSAVVDLDALGDAWPRALQPGIVARGRVLESDEGARAALAAGLAGIVVRQRLPALLACLEADTAAAARREFQDEAHGLAAQADPLPLLRLVALKGQSSLEVLADALGLPVDFIAARCQALCEGGECTRSDRGVRLTPSGQARVKALLANERAGVDPAIAQSLYDEFLPLNAELKSAVAAWQVRNDGTLNDHADAAHDAAVIDRMLSLHARAQPLLQRLAGLAPRLGLYERRLSRARARIEAGERSYITRVMADSYHSVWFELHEELIGLLGRTRAELARRGDGDTA